jgi:hypothetical protein
MGEINPNSYSDNGNPDMLTPRGVNDTGPGAPPAPSAEHHLIWIGRVLDKVGSILGGDETYRVKKQPDGSYAISQDPSTTGEKWGRVASAALGGLGVGLANAQGPGGAARATAAGIQNGLQMPQQQRQEQQQTVDFQNKQLLAKANRIHLTQQTYMMAQQAKLTGMNIDKASQDVLNNYANTMAQHGVDYGTVDPSDPNSAMNLAKTRPGAMDDFLGKGNRVMRFVMEPDHKMHLIGVDQDFERRRNTEPMDIPTEDVDASGKPILVNKPANRVPVNGDTMENINNSIAATQKNYYDHLDKWSTAQKNQRPPEEKPLDTSGKTLDAMRREPDPVKRAQLQRQYQTQLANELSEKGRTGAGSPLEGNPLLSSTPKGATPISPQDQGFIGQITRNPAPDGQRVLDSLPTGTANLVRRFGNYLADEGKELPRGKERGPFLELVSSVYPDFDSAHYEARRDTVKSATGDGKIANSRNALNLAIQHMGEMWDNMQKVDPGEYPATNWAKQAYHQSGGFGDKEVKGAYGGYEDANEGVASEMARVFKGGAPTQTEVNQYRKHADITSPRSSQEGSFKTRAHMLASRLGIINRQLQEGLNTPGKNYQLLTPEAIDTLRKLPGGDEILKTAGVGAAPPTPPANRALNPPAPPGTPNSPNPIKTPPPGSTFDASTWHKVHPNLDLNKAMQQAKKQGLPISNVPTGFNAP